MNPSAQAFGYDDIQRRDRKLVRYAMRAAFGHGGNVATNRTGKHLLQRLLGVLRRDAGADDEAAGPRQMRAAGGDIDGGTVDHQGLGRDTAIVSRDPPRAKAFAAGQRHHLGQHVVAAGDGAAGTGGMSFDQHFRPGRIGGDGLSNGLHPGRGEIGKGVGTILAAHGAAQKMQRARRRSDAVNPVIFTVLQKQHRDSRRLQPLGQRLPAGVPQRHHEKIGRRRDDRLDRG